MPMTTTTTTTMAITISRIEEFDPEVFPPFPLAIDPEVFPSLPLAIDPEVFPSLPLAIGPEDFPPLPLAIVGISMHKGCEKKTPLDRVLECLQRPALPQAADEAGPTAGS